ncbi:MAG: FHA domain-containing protein [Wenzhouxiangella sp.]|nr:MAG: FHA domain-containing protein [Wenzhouxiangella sp.]
MNEKRFYLAPSEDGDTLTETYPVSELPCVVGRAGDCGLQLDFDRISRHHARFEAHAEGLAISDLDSTNGTFVNHQRIDEATPVHAGDIVHFADHGFTLKQRRPGGATIPPAQGSGRERASDTIIGFTALPTGFPVQAPEFFELLNDELVTATSEPIEAANGSRFGHALRARSTHPRLAAEAGTLFRLASDLGEEARLAQLVREVCLKQAAAAGLQSYLFLEVHPVECEDLEILVDELLSLAARYRHLALVCELPIPALPGPGVLGQLQGRLARRDIEICGIQIPPDNLDLLADSARHLSYLRFSAAVGDAAIAGAARALDNRARILVDAVNRREEIQDLATAGASLFQGSAIGQPLPIAD